MCRCFPSGAHCLQVDPEELYFLLLHFLADGPCHEAVASLQQEALKHQLLPARTDFQGVGCSASLITAMQPWTGLGLSPPQTSLALEPSNKL